MHSCTVDGRRLFAGWSHGYAPPLAHHCTFQHAGVETEGVLRSTVEEGMVLNLLQAFVPDPVRRLFNQQVGNQVACGLWKVFWELVIQICNPLHYEILTLVPAQAHPESFQPCNSP